ncbi:MAG: hypothetical protein CM1200mP29_07450 [Verrucomicrobiota bacterium]|nr:MAG: hypothetical protein CM1200mP29_07450 [Verrucomicrobiota bacterium]
MQLRDALREKQLRLLYRGCDREAYTPHAFHEIGALAGPLVKRFAVVGVALEYLVLTVDGRLFGNCRLGQAGGANRDDCPYHTKIQSSQYHKGGKFFTSPG